jgi:hypothetical protein
MDVALTIINDRDHRCRMQNLLGPLSRADPAPRFLLIGPPFLVRHGNPALARPDLAGNQPQTGMAIRIQRQHGMQLAIHGRRLCRSRPGRAAVQLSFEN